MLQRIGKKEAFMWIWFLIGVTCTLGLLAVGAYFKFAALKKAVLKAKLRLDLQLTKRSELVPALSLLAESVAQLGKSFAYSLNQLKEQTGYPMSFSKRVACEEEMSRTLRSLFQTIYQQNPQQPDILFAHLFEEMARTEERIQRCKRNYNSAVRDFNTLARVFPLNLWAGLLDFEVFEYFDFHPSTTKL